MDSLIGTVVAGRFEVLRLLGRGGMGRIYEVELTQLKKRFAIKVLARELAGKEDALLRFRREAEIVASLKHPNIIEIVDWATLDDGRPLYVMELLEGRDLEEHLKAEGPLSWESIAAITAQAVSALLTAHEKGVLHRDLKPTNIFLSEHGSGLEVKIIDFGLARARDLASITMYTSPKLIGTPAYMSPGQLEGKSAVGEEADCWSMAAVLYEAATGKQAFHGAFAELYYMIGKRRPVPVGVLRPDAPPAFSDTIAAALTPSEGRRITSLEELGDRIANSLLGQGAVRASLKSLSRASTRDEDKKEGLPDTLPWGTTVEDAEPAGEAAGKANRAAEAGDGPLGVKDTLPWGASHENEDSHGGATNRDAEAKARSTQRITKAARVAHGGGSDSTTRDLGSGASKLPDEYDQFQSTTPWASSGDQAPRSQSAEEAIPSSERQTRQARPIAAIQPSTTGDSSLPSSMSPAAQAALAHRSLEQAQFRSNHYGIYLLAIVALGLVAVLVVSSLGESTKGAAAVEPASAQAPPADASLDPQAAQSVAVVDAGRADARAEVAAESSQGTLLLTTRPRGASVRIFIRDSKRTVFEGPVPKTLLLPAGEYHVVTMNAGYRSGSTFVEIRADESTDQKIVLKSTQKSSSKDSSPSPRRRKGSSDDALVPTF